MHLIRGHHQRGVSRRRSVDAAREPAPPATQRTCCTWWTCSPTGPRLRICWPTPSWSSVAERRPRVEPLPSGTWRPTPPCTIDWPSVAWMKRVYAATATWSRHGWVTPLTRAASCIYYADGDLANPDRPPLSASFYANSFLEHGQGKYDLSRMATALDETGGGHANACGCRIQPPGLEANMAHWLDMWTNRDVVLKL